MGLASNETLLSMDLAPSSSSCRSSSSSRRSCGSSSSRSSSRGTSSSCGSARSSGTRSGSRSSCSHNGSRGVTMATAVAVAVTMAGATTFGLLLFIHIPTSLSQGMMIAGQRGATQLSGIVAWARGLRTSNHSSCWNWRQSRGRQPGRMRRDPQPVLPPICRMSRFARNSPLSHCCSTCMSQIVNRVTSWPRLAG